MSQGKDLVGRMLKRISVACRSSFDIEDKEPRFQRADCRRQELVDTKKEMLRQVSRYKFQNK